MAFSLGSSSFLNGRDWTLVQEVLEVESGKRKDTDAFLAWAQRRGLGTINKEEKPDLFAIHPDSASDDGSWPSYDLEANTDIDFEGELAAHLAKGKIAVLMQAGAEKLRYVNGVAIAFNARGRVVALTLDDIYRKAARQFRAGGTDQPGGILSPAFRRQSHVGLCSLTDTPVEVT